MKRNSTIQARRMKDKKRTNTGYTPGSFDDSRMDELIDKLHLFADSKFTLWGSLRYPGRSVGFGKSQLVEIRGCAARGEKAADGDKDNCLEGQGQE